jgi:hypothetical protein
MNILKLICLRSVLLIAAACIYTVVFSQEINQEINTVAVKGITFGQVVDDLSKNGYCFETLDTQYKMVKTKLARFPIQKSVFNLSIIVQVQDSVAVITGWFCLNVHNSYDGAPDSCNVVQAKYTYGPYKSAFLQIDKFAKSLKSELIYSKSD